MSETTNIEWTGQTGGPWLGCTEVSPGCAHCYARELMEKRLGGPKNFVRRAYRAAGFTDWETRPIWGDKAPRVLTKGSWGEARRANLKLSRAEVPPKLNWFPSLIDWLDDMPAGILDQEGQWLDRDEVFADFLKLVHDTPFITWQLLTKRPENWTQRITAARNFMTSRDADVAIWLNDWLPKADTGGMPARDGKPPTNVHLGATVEDQPRANTRVGGLLRIPAALHFLSVEPLLGPVLLDEIEERQDNHTHCYSALESDVDIEDDDDFHGRTVKWVIVGGESGTDPRPCNLAWIRDIVRQCKQARVPVFVKQLGANPWADHSSQDLCEAAPGPISLKHPKGGDPEEWPADLRVREWPV